MENKIITISVEEFVRKCSTLAKELGKENFEMGLTAMFICSRLGTMIFHEEESQKAD